MPAEQLVARLDFPRDDRDGLRRGYAVLDSALQSAGLSTQPFPFACHAWRAETAAVAWVLAALCLLLAARRGRGWLVGAGASVVLGLLCLAGMTDRLGPARVDTCLQVVIEPRGMARQELLVGAHFDTKTEPLDHVERTVLFATATLLVGIVAWRLRHRGAKSPRLGAVAALSMLLVAAQLGCGRLLRDRSHGILDDGAAAALLVEIAARARMEPALVTRLRFVWWAGEELGAQGSAAFAGAWTSPWPRAVVNVECVGAGPDIAYAAHEWAGWQVAAADARLVATLREASATPLQRLPYPLLTDAGSFLRRGIPALTILDVPANGRTVRHLHSARDCLAALDGRGIARTRAALQALLGLLDARSAAGRDLDHDPGGVRRGWLFWRPTDAAP